MSDRQREQHARKRSAQRQMERQQQLRENALFYAAAGERVAAFLVSILELGIDFAVEELAENRKSKVRLNALHVFAQEIAAMTSEAELVLEPFRGRVCLDSLDDWWSADEPDEHGSDGDDGADAPLTPIPPAFAEALP